ncbi:hypothetical protein AB0O75_43880 [Streptomyces sp. NPDC088921]|uniref:hypothetical protein n=1 Tax=unclassified Streptomyces TaxID=2593676 RepID=UPI003440E929
MTVKPLAAPDSSLAAGHGSSIGVEPDADGSPYIWVAGYWESLNPHATPAEPPNSHKITRFKYMDGGDLDYFNRGGQYLGVFPMDVATFLNCLRPAIDPYNNRLLIRHMGTTTPWRLALFGLSEVLSSGVISKGLLERAIPANAELGQCVLQGRADLTVALLTLLSSGPRCVPGSPRLAWFVAATGPGSG